MNTATRAKAEFSHQERVDNAVIMHVGYLRSKPCQRSSNSRPTVRTRRSVKFLGLMHGFGGTVNGTIETNAN
jgi:hypothetical protein